MPALFGRRKLRRQMRYSEGQILRLHRRGRPGPGSSFVCVVALAVPPGVSVDVAWAERHGLPRPRSPSPIRLSTAYVVALPDDPQPYVVGQGEVYRQLPGSEVVTFSAEEDLPCTSSV